MERALVERQLGRLAEMPTVIVGKRNGLANDVAARLSDVIVDTQRNLPTMFSITFNDARGLVLDDAGITIGSEIEIRAQSLDSGTAEVLAVGEVTALEGIYRDEQALTIVRGYSPDHRLQRMRRSRAFSDATDSDVARDIARAASLTTGQIDATGTVHPCLVQDARTDWAFLLGRAAEIGYEMGCEEGKFFFRKARTAADGPPFTVDFASGLLSFSPRVSAANLAEEVEVRVWDAVEAKVVAARTATANSAVEVGAGSATEAASVFAPKGAPPPVAGSQEAGPPPGPKAYVLGHRPTAVAAGSDRAVTEAAASAADCVGGAFAEAEGEMLGDPRVRAGTVVTVGDVPAPFAGTWAITGARHVFTGLAHGGSYRTYFRMAGRQDRSVLGLTSAGGPGADGRLAGVVCGLVTDVADPLGLGRVKVTLPWLAPDNESDWAPVTQLGAGAAGGSMFVPEVKEQVLVAFEHGDIRRPYVLGSLVNKRTGAGCLLEPGTNPGAAVVKSGQPATVIRRGFRTPAGSRLVFHDDVPPSGGKPVSAEVVLATESDKISVAMDAVGGTLTLSCKPGSPPGTLTIECDGNVEIKAGPSGSLTIDGGTQLTLKGKSVQIEGTAAVAIKGKPVQLN